MAARWKAASKSDFIFFLLSDIGDLKPNTWAVIWRTYEFNTCFLEGTSKVY